MKLLPNTKAVTLLELLIALTISSMIILSILGLDKFSRFHVITTDRRMTTQNEISYVVEHMVREINNAIGSASEPPVNVTSIAGHPAITVWVDYNKNGKRDAAPADRQIAYAYVGTPSYEMLYYADYTASSSANLTISRNVYMPAGFAPVVTDNYLGVNITGCWDPRKTKTTQDCGKNENPTVTLRTFIKMPSVSTH